jgi:Type I phosphodiesterase / nucleotide pyrophosphatase
MAMALVILACRGVVAAPATRAAPPPAIRHVLLLSIDGMHAVDLANCIAAGSCPNLAALARHAVIYTDAYTSRPSDSFPGTLAEVTGGTPRTTGVYYDDTFDRSLFPPSSHCLGPRGSEVRLTGHLDRDPSRLDGGSPDGLDGNSAGAIDPRRLPEVLSAGHCRPLWPHDYLRVNTVFGVLHASGLRTAWMDKHPAYDILNGPGGPVAGPGRNIDDFFAPEIDATLSAGNLRRTGASAQELAALGDASATFEDSIAAVQLYDELKVRATLAEIAGRDHSGRRHIGTPALFGMNFQAVSVAQKHATGGYRDTRATPSTALLAAMRFVDRSIGRMTSELHRRGLAATTLVIVTAKHGNAPIDRTRLEIISDAKALTPALGPLDRFHVADDVLLEWLASGHHDDTQAVIARLIARQAAGEDLGIGKFYSGRELSLLFGDPRTDSRAPDFILSPRLGVIYANHPGKIAEHGGFHEDDRHVALLVANPALAPRTFAGHVETTQIAPAILEALGLDPRRLQAVRIDGTRALPDLPLRASR